MFVIKWIYRRDHKSVLPGTIRTVISNQIGEGAKKVNKQTKIAFETDLFSQ
jgi:hypothetical protein